MEVFIAALLLVALCVFGLCFNIIFRKDGKFPETEIENNIEMRKRGIKCAKEDEIKMWGKKDKSKITVLTMTDMFANIINKVYNYEEISSSFIN